MTILRPLLKVKKEELYRYCQENQVEYHEIIPIMRATIYEIIFVILI